MHIHSSCSRKLMLATSLDTIASAKRIKRQINLLPGMLYLPLKCKSAAIRLAHSVAVSNKMFSRIKMLRPTGRDDPPERSGVAYCGDERRGIIELEKNPAKLMETLLRNFEKFSHMYLFGNRLIINSIISRYCNWNKIILCNFYDRDNRKTPKNCTHINFLIRNREDSRRHAIIHA